MSLSSAMSTGISGLSMNAEAISVVGNNIANTNTVGFKSGRTVFSDLLSANISGGQVGRGGQIQTVQNIFSQGSFENTSSGNDLALQGDGMFVVKDAISGQQFFTRAGAFSYNNNQILSNPNGLQVMGYGIDSVTGKSNGVLGTIDKTIFSSLSPSATSTASMVINLDSTQTLPGSNPTTTVSFTGKLDNAIAVNTAVQDAAGNSPMTGICNLRDEYGNLLSADLTLTSDPAIAHQWIWQLDVAGATPSSKTLTGTLNFDSATGAFASQTPVSGQTIKLSNGSTSLTVVPDFSSMTEVATANIVPPTGTANGITTSKIRLDGTIDTANAALPVGVDAVKQIIVDAAGQLHTMNIEFTGAGNTLNWTMDTVDSTAGTYPTANNITGTVTFDATTGLFKSFTQDKNTVTFGALPGQTLNLDFSALTQTTTAALTPALAAAAIIPTGKDVFNPANPSQTANYSTTTTVYDTEGNGHTANVYFVKTNANNWDWHAEIPDATGGSPINGTLTFSSAGILTKQTPSATAGIKVLFGGGVTSPQTIKFDFGANISTQLASSSAVSSSTQDGFGAGKLSSTTIDESGYVTATYSNNQTKKIAQVALAKFASLEGLDKAGNSLYSPNAKSGTALLGTADSFNYKVFTNSLEMSNVDMASELVKLIQFQRAYTGNSKTITTADQMMQETLQLKQ